MITHLNDNDEAVFNLIRSYKVRIKYLPEKPKFALLIK